MKLTPSLGEIWVSEASDHFFQIRLEFEQFDLNGPNYMGVCDTDFFLATGGSPTPMICGLNTGQHRKNYPPCLFIQETWNWTKAAS